MRLAGSRDCSTSLMISAFSDAGYAPYRPPIGVCRRILPAGLTPNVLQHLFCQRFARPGFLFHPQGCQRGTMSVAWTGGSGASTVVASVGRQVLPAMDTETAASFLWFAAIQCIESKQDLAGLAPKDCFIPAKPVERVAGQIGQTQKATCERRWRDQPVLAPSWAGLLFRL